MQKKFLSAVVLALASTFAFGCGDDDNDAVLVDDGVVTFHDIDVNDDGFVSAAEWADLDNEWDIDGDGMIDEEEFLMGERNFSTFDLDNDALLSTAEWADAFDEVDLDTDGVIAPDEFI